MKQSAEQIARQIFDGDRRLAARLMRDLDDGQPGAQKVLSVLHAKTGRAHIIGITGNPGAGKSTLVSKLIHHLRKLNRRVGVVAVDPTSPFSGGAILGDRIRMQEHALDQGVFIRSVATRGYLGGLSRSTDDIVHVLDAMGHDVVIIETVGVGQDEIDVVRCAHSALVVLVPGLGDEIQALKAGILEIADLFVVNKADREGADRAAQDLHMMLALGDRQGTAALAMLDRPPGHHGQLLGQEKDPKRHTTWQTPVLMAVATRGEGIAELVQALDLHRKFIKASGGLHKRQIVRAEQSLARLVRDRVWQQVLQRLGSDRGLKSIAERIVGRDSDPYREAQIILDDLGLS